jgi:hypothetical protein
VAQPCWLPQSQDGRHTARSLNPHVIAPEGLADQAVFVLEGRTDDDLCLPQPKRQFD